MSQTQEESPSTVRVELARISAEKALHRFDGGVFDSHAALQHFTAVAEIFARSSFVPRELQGNTANCLIALNMAQRMKEDPLAVMQMIHFIKGRPGFAAKFQVARANALAGWKTPIRWRVERLDPRTLEGEVMRGPKDNKKRVRAMFENLKVTAHAVDGNGELLEASVTTGLAVADGWIDNEKYEHDMENMLIWRSSSRLVGRYAPGVMLGLRTVEELETEPLQVEVGEPKAGPGQALMDRIAASVPAAIDVEVEDDEESPPVAQAPAQVADKIEPPPALADLVAEVAGQAPAKIQNPEHSEVRAASKPAGPAQMALEPAGEPELAVLASADFELLMKLAENYKVPPAARDAILPAGQAITRRGCLERDHLMTAIREELKEYRSDNRRTAV